jgi:aldehyde dehydrogenase (NAD+)
VQNNANSFSMEGEAMTAVANVPLVGKHFLRGRWTEGKGARFESRNPARWSEVVGVFPQATADEVEEAIRAARDAYSSWRRMSRIYRAELFDRLAQLIKAETESLAVLMARECGKVLNECRAEIVEGLHMVQYVFGTARMPMGEVLASEIAEKDAYVRRKPRGVAAIITPWNFPFAVPLWMLGPSLLEGNTVIFKPSEDTPAIGQALVELFERAGFPPGVINLVHGAGEVGELLVRDPRVNLVLFTGSYEVGSKIQQLSAGIVDRICACEMGSKSAVIVCEDARMDIAVTAGILSAFKTSGQRCVSAGRILVHEKRFEEFADRFVQLARRLNIGDPLDERNFTGPVINEAAVRKISYYNQLAREEGGEVLLDGGRMLDEAHRDGWYMSPFIYRIHHRPGIRCIREEVFGPHVALIPFASNEEAAAIYNDTDYGLSLAVITEDYRAMRYFREECDFGMGYVNLPCIGAEVHLPFGGVKKSGNGRPSAAGLIETVTHRAAWTVNHGLEIKMAQGLKATLD